MPAGQEPRLPLSEYSLNAKLLELLKQIAPGGAGAGERLIDVIDLALSRFLPPGWPRSLRDQCAAAGVAFFFKQWGEWHPRRDDDGQVRIIV
jgi:protein gp37